MKFDWQKHLEKQPRFFGIPVVLGVLLLIPFLGTISGLHGDEAWAGVRAHEIMEGKLPLLGMNGYTGPIQQYLLSAELSVLGYNVFCLRLLTVITSLIGAVLYFNLAKRLFGARVAGVAAILLVSLPFFTVYSRSALEIFTLNPILSIGGILLLLEGNERANRRRFWLWLLSGMCFGLGTWNHLIFLSVPVSILVVALFSRRLSFFGEWRSYMVAYGFLFALAPRLYYEFAVESQGAASVSSMVGSMFWDQALDRLAEWPLLLVQLVHGDPIYQKYSGEIRFLCPNLVLPLLGIGIVAHLKTHGFKWSPSAIRLYVFSTVLFVSTVLLCQRSVDQYFLLILYVTPLFLAFAFEEIIECGIPRYWGVGLLVIFVGLQLTRTGCNYFASQLSSHGRIAKFEFGSGSDTSNNFVRTDGLYEKLISLGAKHVYAEFFIAMPLRFYDLDKNRFASVHIVEATHEIPPRAEHPTGAYAVTYVKGGLRRMRDSEFEGFTEIFSDEHFIILKALDYVPKTVSTTSQSDPVKVAVIRGKP